MELNTLFLLVFLVVVGVGLCCMGYCACLNKKQPPEGMDKA